MRLRTAVAVAVAAAVAAVAVVALAGARRGDRPSPRGHGEAPGPVATLPAPAPAPSPSTAPFENGGPCPVATGQGLPSGAGCVSEVRADLDGDGRADRFLVYAKVGDDATPRSWFAAAVLAAGRRTEAVRVPTGQGVGSVYPRVLSAVDANGEPGAEVFVQLSAILYHVGGQRIATVYGLDDGRVRRATVRRAPLEFRTGGIGPYGNGALCSGGAEDARFAVRHIRREPSQDWGWTERVFEWRGLDLRPVGVLRGTVPGDVFVHEPRVRRFYQLRCGPLVTS